MKLDINPKKKFEKPSNTWRLKNILLKNKWANREVKEEIKKYMETGVSGWLSRLRDRLRSVSLSPVSGLVLIAQSLDPAWDSRRVVGKV